MGQKILVAVDGSEASERALEYAAKVGNAIHDAHLTLFNVGEATPAHLFEHDLLPGEGTAQDRLERHWEKIESADREGEEGRKALFEHLKQRAESLGLQPEQIDARFSVDGRNISKEIISEAEKGEYDVICLGKRGRSSMSEYLIGSVSERVVRHARKCTVWVVE